MDKAYHLERVCEPSSRDFTSDIVLVECKNLILHPRQVFEHSTLGENLS